MKNRLTALLVTLTVAVTAFAANPRLECMQFFGEQYRRMPDTKVVITSSSGNRYYSISVYDNAKLESAIEKAVETDRSHAFNTVESYSQGNTSIILNIEVNDNTVTVGFNRRHDADDDDENYVRLFVSGSPDAFK